MTLRNRLQWPFAPAEKKFGQDISPEHLRIGKDGTVQVSLAGNWPELTQHLSGLGEVVATTNNQAASLTQIGCYPNFKICSCGRSACSLNCGLAFDFSAWRHVWATRRKCDDGIWRTLSVSNCGDFANHQVLLSAEMDDERFTELVRKFSPTKNFGANFPRWSWPLNSSRNPRQTGHTERLRRRKREFIENAESGSRAIHPESLAEVWRNVLAERIQLGTTVVTMPVVHSTLWQPVSFMENSGALTASSNNIFFHCQPEKIEELWVVPLSQEPDSPVALEVYDAHDDLLFALAVPTEWKSIWNELLHWLPAV